MSWPSWPSENGKPEAKFVDEVYAIADQDYVAATGKTPGGISLAELEQQMQALQGESAAEAAA